MGGRVSGRKRVALVGNAKTSFVWSVGEAHLA